MRKKKNLVLWFLRSRFGAPAPALSISVLQHAASKIRPWEFTSQFLVLKVSEGPCGKFSLIIIHYISNFL